VLDETLAVVEVKTLCDKMCDVKAKANMLDDAPADVEAKRLGDTQLVETLATR